mgnify:CR=1 FL=1
MAARLVVRGANINYVNTNGNTALHLCVENKFYSAVKFLLSKGADPHVMDLKGEDSCDKAIMNGMDKDFKSFQDCSLRKKIIPLLPNGTHPNFD